MTYLRTIALLFFLLGLAACTAVGPPPVLSTSIPVPITSSPTPKPTVVPTATPLACLLERGALTRRVLDSTKPPQEFLIYLPPCYDQKPDESYPVLYLLHGQTYKDDQWVSLGAAVAADNLIHASQAPPFIIVFPDDRYWNLPPGPGFGDRLLNIVIPFVDQNYRTLTDRDHRALGGLSRGGGWTIHLALTRYDLFGTIGLHSPVIFDDDAVILQNLVRAVPANAWPRLWLDAGDHDGGLSNIRALEAMLTVYEVPHVWRMYTGDHSDSYWHAHIGEYIQWYADGFTVQAAPTSAASATPTP